MTVDYEVSLEDYKAAMRLHRNGTTRRRISFAIWFIGVPMLAFAGLSAFVVFNLSKATHYAATLFGLECALIWLSLYLPAWRFYTTRKCFKQVFERRDIQLEVTEDAIRSIIAGVSEGKFFWNEEMALAQDNQVVLIYVAKTRFILVPSRYLPPVQFAELQQLFEQNARSRGYAN